MRQVASNAPNSTIIQSAPSGLSSSIAPIVSNGPNSTNTLIAADDQSQSSISQSSVLAGSLVDAHVVNGPGESVHPVAEQLVRFQLSSEVQQVACARESQQASQDVRRSESPSGPDEGILFNATTRAPSKPIDAGRHNSGAFPSSYIGASSIPELFKHSGSESQGLFEPFQSRLALGPSSSRPLGASSSRPFDPSSSSPLGASSSRPLGPPSCRPFLSSLGSIAAPSNGQPGESSFMKRHVLPPERADRLDVLEEDSLLHLNHLKHLGTHRQVEGTLSGMPVNDVLHAAVHIMHALLLREKYCSLALHAVNKTTSQFLAEYKNWLPEGNGLKTMLRNVLSMSRFDDEDRPSEYNRKQSIMELPVTVYPMYPIHPYQRPLKVPQKAPKETELRMQEAVMHIYERDAPTDAWRLVDLGVRIPTLDEFLADIRTLNTSANEGPLKTFAFRRCEQSFELYVLLNELRETAEQKAIPHRLL